jgi:HK97 family phage major capsid protein
VTAVKPMLWGVPVILPEYMTEKTALVANFKIAATVYVRQPPVVEVAPYGGRSTEFIANQTLVRAEERLALAVHHPAAICLVTAV